MRLAGKVAIVTGGGGQGPPLEFRSVQISLGGRDGLDFGTDTPS
jgi:hypothetical protein